MKVDWATCARVGISGFVLYLCVTYWSSAVSLLNALLNAAMPLLLGCVLAYLINILMNFYEKHDLLKVLGPSLIRIRRPVGMLAAYFTLFLLVMLVVDLVVPELASCVKLLLSQVPRAIDMLIGWLETKNLVPEDIQAVLGAVDWKSKMDQMIRILTSGVGSVMGTAISAIVSVFSSIVTALLAFIFSVYLLMGKEKLASQFQRLMRRYLRTGFYSKVRYILSVMNECFHNYIVGQCTEAVILGVLCTVGMLLLRIPYATMIGAVVAFTALIPVAGAYIGAGVGAFMIFTVAPIKALVFLAFIVILQQLEGNLIYPRVVGSSLGLPAIWVLAAVTIGGGIMGIAGMLLCVPLAAVIYRLLREDVKRTPEKENVAL